MLDDGFLREFKSATEAKWSETSINPTVDGFQFQRGTRWNAGLSVEQIAKYEAVLSVEFPHDFKAFLHAMNGTDLATLNIYGSCGEPSRHSVGVYSYPRDIEIVKLRIEHARASRNEIVSDLARQGFELQADANLVPIYPHRYLVCTSDLNSSVVLSIIVNEIDAIVYGHSLRDYLRKRISERFACRLVGFVIAQLPGDRAALRPLSPLRTGLESFPSSGSSTPNAPMKKEDAASFKCE